MILDQAEKNKKNLRFLIGNFHEDISRSIANTKESITIFSPYMKTQALERIIKDKNNNVTTSIFTCLRARDLSFGATDKDIYRYAIENNIYCYINNNLHMKAYIYDYDTAHIGSANCTLKGLGIAKKSNHEILIFNEVIPQLFKVYCNSIQSKSIILNESVVSYIDSLISGNLDNYGIDLKKIAELDKAIEDRITESRQILASQLPLVEKIDDIYIFITKGVCSLDKNTLIHDVDLFNLSDKKFTSLENFKEILLEEFMRHPFISLIFKRDEDSLNFGYIRKLLEEMCIDDPRPNRLEINILINNLFCWLENLSGRIYRVKQPNHTKILFKNRQNEKCQ